MAVSVELRALVAPLLAADVARIPSAIDAFLGTPGSFGRLVELDREICATFSRWHREFAFRQLCAFAGMDERSARKILSRPGAIHFEDRIEVKRGYVASSLLRMAAWGQVPALDADRYAAFARVWVGRVEYIERNVSA